MSSPEMISLAGVRFQIGSTTMVFDFAMAAGQSVALIGPSGAGKSTLLNLVAGFEAPDSGIVALNGVAMAGVAPQNRPVSIIFQDINSFAHLDVWTNVALGIRPNLRLDEAERARIDQALADTGLSELARRLPGAVSGGERQRIALARVLLRGQPILLMDEALTALGPAQRRDMMSRVRSLQKEKGLTLLFITHDPEEAQRGADTIAYLENGRIIGTCPAEDLFNQPALPGLGAYLGLA